MRAYRSLGEVPEDFGPSAVTIGKFDGVHLGHLALVGRLCAEAAERGLRPTVLTFDRNPLALIAPESCPAPVQSLDQRRERLTQTGVAALVELAFDARLRDMSAEEFVRQVLVEVLDARLVMIGPDFRYGAGGQGDAASLTRAGALYGFEVLIVGEVVAPDGQRASSSRIRRLLAEGDVAGAARLLGQPHTLRSEIVHGEKRGRELGYPTANLRADPEGMIPADGVYAGWVIDGDARFPAAISVGNNPTFDGVPAKQVEAHLLDVDLDLYGHVVEVQFVDRVRGMAKFSSIDELITAMARDVREVRVLLAANRK